MDREEYMSAALALAREAFDEGEIPVGCVIADAQGNIIGRGAISERRVMTQLSTPSWRPFAQRAGRRATGGSAAAQYMSPSSHVRCVPEA